MDVWMTQARRISRCHYCPEPIRQLDPEVIGQTKRTKGGRTFTRIRRWHPQCWITQGLSYIEQHPVVIRQGRPRLELDPVTRHRRLQLLRSHAQLMHYSREAWTSGNILRSVHCWLKASDLHEEMSQLGGVPKGWLPDPAVEDHTTSDPAVDAPTPLYLP